MGKILIVLYLLQIAAGSNLSDAKISWSMYAKEPLLSHFSNEGPDTINLELKWQFSIPSKKNTPYQVTPTTIIENKVIFGSADKHVYCIDKTTGTLNWKSNIGGFIYRQPAYSNKKIIVLTSSEFKERELGYIDNVACLNIENGNVIWTIDKYSNCDLVTPPIIENNIFLLISGTKGSSMLNKISSIKVEDGTINWEYELNEPGYFSCPAVSDGKVYIGYTLPKNNYGKLLCIDIKTGEIIWSYENLATYSISIDKNIAYFTTKDFKLYCFDLINKKILWQKENYKSYSVSYNTENIYLFFQDKLTAFDKQNGDVKWSKIIQYPMTDITLFKNYLMIGDPKFAFFILDSKTGNELFYLCNESNYLIESTIGGSVVADDCIFISSSIGSIYCYKEKK